MILFVLSGLENTMPENIVFLVLGNCTVEIGYGYSYRASYAAPQTNEYWVKTSYDSDQVRRPVIVDADARKRPVVSVTSQNRDSQSPCCIIALTS